MPYHKDQFSQVVRLMAQIAGDLDGIHFALAMVKGDDSDVAYINHPLTSEKTMCNREGRAKKKARAWQRRNPSSVFTAISGLGRPHNVLLAAIATAGMLNDLTFSQVVDSDADEIDPEIVIVLKSPEWDAVHATIKRLVVTGANKDISPTADLSTVSVLLPNCTRICVEIVASS